MKHTNGLKMLAVATAIAMPFCLMAPAPLLAAKPVKETVCNVGNPAYPTILSAVADTNCDSINVPAGTFGENVSIGRDVTIRGAGPGSTIINGGDNGPVFAVGWSTVTLKGMTIIGGKTPPSSRRPNGGGISSVYSTLTVKDCLITGNEALALGGGIQSIFGTLIVKDSIITDNTATSGGGIWGAGSANVVIVIDSVIADNEATSTHASVPPEFSGRGGGILCFNTTPGGAPCMVTVKDSRITGNEATTEGGGIYISNTTLTVKDSTITDNTPDQIAP